MPDDDLKDATEALQERLLRQELQRVSQRLSELYAQLNYLNRHISECAIEEERLVRSERQFNKFKRSTTYKLTRAIRAPFVSTRDVIRRLRGRNETANRVDTSVSPPTLVAAQNLRRSESPSTAAGDSNLPPKASVAKIRCIKPPSPPHGELALFVTHSPDGYLRPHVVPYISSLKRNSIEVILIIATDAEFTDAQDDLLSILSGLYIRQNVGFDFSAWSHIFHVCPDAWNSSIVYLLNDSILGPIDDDSFTATLARIRQSSADLVGLTDSQEIRWHIQSYFLAVKGRGLTGPAFKEFMASVRSHTDKDEVIQEYEVALATKMREAGLTCEALYPSVDKKNPTIFYWRELVEKGSPFIKFMVIREHFEGVDNSTWQEVLRRRGYDTTLVERSLLLAQLRTYPMP
jgi:Rhamnan synthesis protein F